jgi:hypothetical protein
VNNQQQNEKCSESRHRCPCRAKFEFTPRYNKIQEALKNASSGFNLSSTSTLLENNANPLNRHEINTISDW